jgi:hypothetical protein
MLFHYHAAMKTHILLVLLTLPLAGMSLHADTLFSDNFNSYTAGANLAGQGGWTGCGSLPVDTGSVLPTQVVRVDEGSSSGCTGPEAGFAILSQSFSGSIASGEVSTLSFDAYAPTNSHDMNVLLGTGDLGSDFSGVYLETNNFVPGWRLTLFQNADAVSFVDIPGGAGMPVSMSIVVDEPDQLTYAVYDFGAGPQTTSTLSFVGFTGLNSWTDVSIIGDYRFGLPQGEIDNISLTQTGTVPESSTLLLTSLAGVALLVSKKFRLG